MSTVVLEDLMAQNIYDDSNFLAGYATLDRQVRGLDGAAEWPVLQSTLPRHLRSASRGSWLRFRLPQPMGR